jgi:hypothetical protein
MSHTIDVLAALQAMTAQALATRQGNGSFALRDIAADVDLPVNMVWRILREAQEKGLVAKPERGRYFATSAVGTPAQQDPDDLDDFLLARLYAQLQLPVLLYVHARLAGANTRVLVRHVYGHRGAQIRSAPLHQQRTLRQAPLHTDPAGLAILTQLMRGQDLGPSLRPIRDAALAVGRAPINGMAGVFVPFWAGPTVAGSLGVLAPLDLLRNEAGLARTSRCLASFAQTYSRRTTVETAMGQDLHDAG